MNKVCSMCGSPFGFKLGPNGKIPPDIYHSLLFIESREEYWECPKCYQSSTPKVKIPSEVHDNNKSVNYGEQE